jgi:hypothetical protein
MKKNLLNEEDRERIAKYLVEDDFEKLPTKIAADKEIEKMMRKIRKKIKVLG